MRGAKMIYETNYKNMEQLGIYQLSNNNANINRIKDRITQLEQRAQDTTEEHQIGDIQIIDNVEENRIQIFFPDIPSPEIRSKLKSEGCRWARSNGCWQCYRGAWRLKRIISILS
jgi:hypothetical protein